MRVKEDIIKQSRDVAERLPNEGKLMVLHETLFLEVVIDIRDILKDLSRMIAVQAGSTDIS